jgi:hypothetical protein
MAGDLSDDAILDRFPTRVPSVTHMESGRVTIHQGPEDITLSPMGTRVYSLCSGKLNGREIVDEIHRSLNGQAPPYQELSKDVLGFIRSLDETYAVFLKDY